MPKPGGEVFDGGIWEAFDLVEVGVIENVEEGGHGDADAGVVVNPAHVRVDFAFDDNFDFEAVAMHLAARMVGGDVGEGLGCFEGEIFA
jgi:hypothetical protein